MTESVVPMTSASNYWYWYWPDASIPTYTVRYIMPNEPETCIGKAHVFECEHVSKCKCGGVKRVMRKVKK